MDRAWALSVATFTLLVAGSRPACADATEPDADLDEERSPCEAVAPEAGAPVRAPLSAADFGMIPEACARYELSMRGHLALLIDEPDFYGSLGAGAALRGRLPLPGGGWVSAMFPGYAYRFVANATVEAESSDLSPSTVALHIPVTVSGRLGIAPYVRWLLPTETALENASRFGFEQGISFVAPLHPMFELTGGYALPLLLTTNARATQSVFMPTVALDAGLRPWRWLHLMAGGQVRVVPSEPDDAFESFDVRAALRFYPHEGLLVDLGAAVPLGGRDRTNAAIGLGLGWVAEP